MIKNLFSTIESYKEIIVIIGIPLLGIGIPLFQYFHAKAKEQRQINFVRFHEKIIYKIVNYKEHKEMPDVKLDQQVAAIFELRNLPEYYSVSKRILTFLKEDWKAELQAHPHYQRLIEEADETLKYMNYNIITRFLVCIENRYL